MGRKKLKIVVDMDGVIGNLTEVACARAGVDINKFDRYGLDANKKLTDAEKKLIIKEFSDVECFRETYSKVTNAAIGWLRDLCEEADVTLHSFSWTDDIQQFKREWIADRLPFIDEKHLILEKVHNAELKIAQCDVLVEDRFNNILSTRAKNHNCVGILVRHHYNERHTVMECLCNSIMVAGSFEMAMMLALKIVKDLSYCGIY